MTFLLDSTRAHAARALLIFHSVVSSVSRALDKLPVLDFLPLDDTLTDDAPLQFPLCVHVCRRSQALPSS